MQRYSRDVNFYTSTNAEMKKVKALGSVEIPGLKATRVLTRDLPVLYVLSVLNSARCGIDYSQVLF